MTTNIDDKLREMVLGGSAYQARELAHALDLAEWAELLDLLLDHWHITQGVGLWVPFTQHTEAQAGRLIGLANRLSLYPDWGWLYADWGSSTGVEYQAASICKRVYLCNPDIRARVIAEAAP